MSDCVKVNKVLFVGLLGSYHINWLNLSGKTFLPRNDGQRDEISKVKSLHHKSSCLHHDGCRDLPSLFSYNHFTWLYPPYWRNFEEHCRISYLCCSMHHLPSNLFTCSFGFLALLPSKSRNYFTSYWDCHCSADHRAGKYSRKRRRRLNSEPPWNDASALFLI